MNIWHFKDNLAPPNESLLNYSYERYVWVNHNEWMSLPILEGGNIWSHLDNWQL